MLAKLNSTEEYLEKTVTLREKPVLAITSGPGAGRVFSVSDQSATSIGRAKFNDIVLEDISVSSEHCRIRPENDGFAVHDLKSTNGTYVNEKKVTHHPLTPGDVVKVGETLLQFRLDHQPAS
jgi:pSer/pThr/pTyr-binding forkhead associated (FHA) protein